MAKKGNYPHLINALARGKFAIHPGSIPGYFSIAQNIIRDAGSIVNSRLSFDDDFPEDDQVGPEDDTVTAKIAVMKMTGVVMHYGGPCNYGSEDYAMLMFCYQVDPSISAVIIKGNSPGGQIEGTQTFVDAVLECRKTKPVLGFVDDGMIASAALWIFSACTEIYASHATCEIGSAGTMSILTDMRKALENDGIKQIITYAPQSTQKNKDTRDALDGNTAMIEADLKFLCDIMLVSIEENRDGRLTSDSWKNAAMFFAQDATDIGLIDGIKSFAEVTERAQELATHSNYQSSNMLGFKRFNSLAALKGTKGAEITPAQVLAVNTEIVEEKIEGVTLVLDTEMEAVNTSATQATAALTQINGVLGAGNEKQDIASAVSALVAAHSGSAATIKNLTAEVTKLKEDNAKLGKLPAAESSDPAKPAGKAEEQGLNTAPVIEAWNDPNLSFNAQVDGGRVGQRKAAVVITPHK